MSDVQSYIFHHGKNSSEAAKSARETAIRLEQKQLRLLTLVESLGEYLNHEDTTVRYKTLSFLAEVLESLSPGTLSLQQRSLLCEFLTSRVSDESDTLPICARALIALDKLGQWQSKQSVTLIDTIIQNTTPLVRFKLQSERYVVLQLVDRLLAKHRDDLKNHHDQTSTFLTGLLALVDGEKDPRNLMIIFSFLLVPLAEWDIHQHAQELFDAVFNYFPITFQPPPNDPYRITAQDLKDRLRRCISASAELAPYAFPALLDKLDSSSLNTKRDVLATFRKCAKNYGYQTLNLYSITLWDALKFEILQAQEEDLARAALDVLVDVTLQLSNGNAAMLATYLKPITKEANEHLEDAPTKQSQAAERILGGISAATPESFNFVWEAVLPNILALYDATSSTAKRRGLIECMDALLKANLVVFGEWFRQSTIDISAELSVTSSVENRLIRTGGPLLDLLIKALAGTAMKEVSFRTAALGMLTNLCKARNTLKDGDIRRVIILLTEIILEDEAYGADDVKALSIKSLVAIAHQKPQLVIDVAFPIFLSKLPQSFEAGDHDFVLSIESFALLAQEPELFDTIVTRLDSRIQPLLQPQLKDAGVNDVLRPLLSAMLYAFKQNITRLRSEPTRPYLHKISRSYISSLLNNVEPSESLPYDLVTIELVGHISNIILREQSVELQSSLEASLPYSLWTGNLEWFHSLAEAHDGSVRYRPLVISTYLLAAFRRNALQSMDYEDLLPRVCAIAMNATCEPRIRQTAAQQIALVLNKFVAANKLEEVTSLVHRCLDTSDGNYTAQNENRIRVEFSVAKALLLCNAKGVLTSIQRLIDGLSGPPNSILIARGFATLLQPDDLLNKDNYCTVAPLHKQKLFGYFVANVTNYFTSADALTRKCYLIALSGLLRWTPFAIVEPQLLSLIPLLLQTLDLTVENEVKAPAIDTIATVLVEQPEQLEEHAGSLISRLLAATAAQSNQAGVRAKALHCLALLPRVLRRETMMPFRRQVVKRLTEALDDKRRAVRLEAVACRKGWIELDKADNDDDA